MTSTSSPGSRGHVDAPGRDLRLRCLAPPDRQRGRSRSSSCGRRSRAGSSAATTRPSAWTSCSSTTPSSRRVTSPARSREPPEAGCERIEPHIRIVHESSRRDRRTALVRDAADPERLEPGGAGSGEVLAWVVADVGRVGRRHVEQPARDAEWHRRGLDEAGADSSVRTMTSKSSETLGNAESLRRWTEASPSLTRPVRKPAARTTSNMAMASENGSSVGVWVR